MIGGKRLTLHLFCMYLPHSDAIFVKAYPAETTEALLDGMTSSFAFFGGVPQSVLLDNMKLAVVRILPDGTRERTAALTRLISHYLFKDRYGRPGRGKDKGNVEALVKFTRHAFLTPVPNEPSFAALNATLERHCLARLGEVAGRDPTPIGERLGRSGGVPLTAERGLRSLRHATRPGQLDGLGALPERRLLGPNGARLHDGFGEGVRR